MFSYVSYQKMIQHLKKNGYDFVSFSSKQNQEHHKIYLRHDIDNDFLGSINLAQIEKEEGVSAIYFFQPNSDYYNILSRECLKVIKQIDGMNHELGLHIDASLCENMDDLNDYIEETFKYYSNFFKMSKVISFHCPSLKILKDDLKIKGWIHTYEKRFFKDLVYFSDSSRRCFQDKKFYDTIKEGKSMQLLTHPIWWESKNQSLYEVYESFYEKMNQYILKALRENKGPFSYLVRK